MNNGFDFNHRYTHVDNSLAEPVGLFTSSDGIVRFNGSSLWLDLRVIVYGMEIGNTVVT